MIFRETGLPGAFLVEPERREDERGFFTRTWCQREAAERGISVDWAQCSVSYNRWPGTLRGMHYQAEPHAEAKLIRCTQGAIHDVILDLRPESPTFGRHFSARLSAQNHAAVFAPAGFAHGFLTLEPESEVYYQISAYYVPEAARGVRWDDPAFGILWPGPVRAISDRDCGYPDWRAGTGAEA